MAIARVGSIGTVATGTTTCSPSFPQATTAGNLLILWIACDSSSAAGASGGSASWQAVPQGNNGLKIYYLENCGAGETAPSCVGGTSAIAGVFCEFSGAATLSSFDVTGNTVSLSSPATATASGADVAGGELVVGLSSLAYSMAATKTTTHAYNNGASAVAVGDNDATSSASHFRFSYGITTGNSAADALTVTFTTTNIVNTSTSQVASFKIAASAGVLRKPATEPLPFIPRGRSM